MKKSLFIYCVLFVSRPLHAEVVHCGKQDGQVEYTLSVARLAFAIEHPFRVFPGEISGLTGTLVANPKNLREGMGIKIVGSWRSFEFADGRMNAWALGKIDAEHGTIDAPLEFQSRAVDLSPFLVEATGEFRVKVLGQLTLHGITHGMEAPLECRVDVGHWKCTTEFLLRHSDYALPRLNVLGIGPRDEVKVRGEIVFAPPKKDTDS